MFFFERNGILNLRLPRIYCFSEEMLLSGFNWKVRNENFHKQIEPIQGKINKSVNCSDPQGLQKYEI